MTVSDVVPPLAVALLPIGLARSVAVVVVVVVVAVSAEFEAFEQAVVDRPVRVANVRAKSVDAGANLRIRVLDSTD